MYPEIPKFLNPETNKNLSYLEEFKPVNSYTSNN